MTGDLPLALSLAHATALLGRARAGGGLRLARSAAAGDLFIDLPDLGGGAAGEVSAAALETMASLYLAAEVEETYLPAVAEQLALHRFGLNLTDAGAAAELERLAEAMDGAWVGRELRNQIFLRVFGIGQSDPSLGGSAANREFEPLFARLCGALAQLGRSSGPWGAEPGTSLRAVVAAQAVVGNLGARMQGNTLIVTERLTRQLSLSVAALNHQGLTTLFMGRTAWDVVRGVLGPDTPDLLRPVTRGQTGLRLLSFLAGRIAAIQAADPAVLEAGVAATPQVPGWAELWLDAAGTPMKTAPAPAQGQLVGALA